MSCINKYSRTNIGVSIIGVVEDEGSENDFVFAVSKKYLLIDDVCGSGPVDWFLEDKGY